MRNLGKTLILFLFSLLWAAYLYSQDPIVGFSYGNILDNSPTSVKTFKEQTGINISKNYIIDTAKTLFKYLKGTDTLMVDYYPTFDSINFNKGLNLLKPGSSVTFILSLNCINGKKYAHYAHYAIISDSDIVINYEPSPALKEAKSMFKWQLISGTIYFSGSNFTNVATINVKSDTKINNYLERCGPGSIITLDNVVYKDENGKVIGPINHSIKLD